MAEQNIRVLKTIDKSQLQDIQKLLNACAEIDGLNPFSEHTILHLQNAHEFEVSHYMYFEESKLVGYAHVDLSDPVLGPNVEVAVLPLFRRHGVGKKLLDEIVGENYRKPIRLWAHGLNTGANSLAASCGFKQVRTLWQMRRSLITPIPESTYPDNVSVRNFQIDSDFESLLKCNQIAFADHPEQGSWSESHLQQRISEDWFDPNGLKIIKSADEIVGYGWTKVDDTFAGSKLGEIYVIGVRPEWQQQGLGKALTLDSLRYLRSLNLNTALLYVDAENRNAISLYESLGFSHWDTDTLFQLN